MKNARTPLPDNKHNLTTLLLLLYYYIYNQVISFSFVTFCVNTIHKLLQLNSPRNTRAMPAGLTLPPARLETDLHLTLRDYAIAATSPSPSTPPNEPATPRSPPCPLTVGRRRLDAFHIMCLIGKGGFGKVFMVRHKCTARIYAMKVMDKSALIDRQAVRDAHAEKNVLALVGQKHAPFIVRLHVAFQTSRRVYLVMDFASGGELMFHLRREAMLSEDDARFYAAELLVALQHLHALDVVHRDIKPENVLLDGEGHLVLTDFGLAKEVCAGQEQTHSWCGSDDYMAPEIIARTEHSGKPADYWAYGIFIFDCLNGSPPFSPLHEKGKLPRKKLHERILRQKPKLPKFFSRECHSLLRGLLTKDIGKRLTDALEIRKHAWFAGIDWEALERKEVAAPIVPSQSSPTACFSPSLTKTEHSAPSSPVSLGERARSQPIAVGTAVEPDNMWQGFSFVAPGMEVHFELAAPVERAPISSPDGCGFVSTFGSPGSPRADAIERWEEPLMAELEEFCVDAQEAVEIVEADEV